jgi:hypothetical protein
VHVAGFVYDHVDSFLISSAISTAEFQLPLASTKVAVICLCLPFANSPFELHQAQRMAGIENVWNGLGYTQHEVIPTAGDSTASPAPDHGVERSSFPRESSPKGNAGNLDLDSPWAPFWLMPPPDSLVRHRVVHRLRPAQRSSFTVILSLVTWYISC